MTSEEPQPEIIQLAGDGPAAGNAIRDTLGSSILSTWTNALGVSQELLRKNTQTDFQMPDVSCADDLAMHVPQDLCIKIWKHEYINLAALLKKKKTKKAGGRDWQSFHQ